MAAPTKQGLDYFRYSMGLLKDRKLRRVKMKYGPAAPLVYLSLLELIYSDKGYYTRWDDDTVWEILEYLQGAYCPNAETVRKIVEDLAACGLFDGDCFNSKILTSKRIQAEYYNATVERKAVDVDFSVWILSESEMRSISGKSVILHNFINRPINGVNRPINGDNQANYQQSRVEKSRVEKSREENTQSEEDCGENPSDFPLSIPFGISKKEDLKEDPLVQQGSYRFVSLRKSEWENLVKEVGAHGANRCLDILNRYKGSTGKKYKSDYWAIQNWVIDAWKKEEEKKASSHSSSYDIDEFNQRGFHVPKVSSDSSKESEGEQNETAKRT